MSYASDYDDFEQVAQGEEFGRESQKPDFFEYCRTYHGNPDEMSGNDLSHARWSYAQWKKGK